MELENQENE